jgi:hypothetical protein
MTIGSCATSEPVVVEVDVLVMAMSLLRDVGRSVGGDGAEDVEPGGTAGGEDRSGDPGECGDDGNRRQLAARDRERSDPLALECLDDRPSEHHPDDESDDVPSTATITDSHGPSSAAANASCRPLAAGRSPASARRSQRERVRDPDQGDEDGECEQRVDQVQHLSIWAPWASLNSVRSWISACGKSAATVLDRGPGLRYGDTVGGVHVDLEVELVGDVLLEQRVTAR